MRQGSIITTYYIDFNMMEKLGWAFGIVLTLVGILGFVPGIASGGLLLGIFMVDPLHNIVHLLSGLLALGAVSMWKSYLKLYFQVFGVVYALVAVIGLVQGNTILGILVVNMADNLLHVAIAAAALWAGFGLKQESMAMGATM